MTENPFTKIIGKVIEQMIDEFNIYAGMLSLLVAIYCKNTSKISKLTQIKFEPYEEGVIGFICSYLLFRLLMWIYSKAKTKCESYRYASNNPNIFDTNYDAAIDKFKDKIDKMPSEAKQQLKYFYRTDNESVKIRHLLSDPYLVNIEWTFNHRGTDNEGGFIEMKLKPEYFNLLKLSIEHDGKLGHFEDIGIK